VIISTHRFLFFLERDFHIAVLKPLMEYIYTHSLGMSKVYAPFSSTMSATLKKNLSFAIEIVDDPYTWNPEITFLCDFSYQYVEGLGRLVNIGHGTISKGWFFSRDKISQRENCADLLCVPGTIHKERLEKQVYIPIEVAGMPKMDKCFDGSLRYADLMDRFGLDTEQKTVLLAPTFNDEFSILPFLQAKDLSQLFPDFVNLIVKVHGVTDNSIKEQFYSFAETRPNVYIADTYDTHEFYFIADLLISDVSSVIYEFLSLKKPVLLFDSPRQKEYINYNEADLEWKYRNVGVRFTEADIDKLPLLIFNVLTANKDFVNPEIGEMFISVRDGSSAEKIVSSAINLLISEPDNHLCILTDSLTDNLRYRVGSSIPIIESVDDVFVNLVKITQETDFQYILYLNSSYDFSPQLPRLMLNQMINNPDALMAVPLIDDNGYHSQNFRTLVKLADDMSFTHAGIQLSYAFAGQTMDIDNVLPYCFIVRADTLQLVQFSNIARVEPCLREYIAYAQQKNQSILLAYDCLVKKHI